MEEGEDKFMSMNMFQWQEKDAFCATFIRDVILTHIINYSIDRKCTILINQLIT